MLKSGIVYGRDDHMLDHVSRMLATVPVFGLTGFRDRRLRPLAVEDLVDVTVVATTGDRLSEVTVPVPGPEELTLQEAIPHIWAAIGHEPNCLNAVTSSGL